MSIILHKNIPEGELHNPKGFNDPITNSMSYSMRSESDVAIFQDIEYLPGALNFVDGNNPPPTTVLDDIYVIIDGGGGVVDAGWGAVTFNSWCRYDSTSWIGVAAVDGFQCYDKTAKEFKFFNGTVWVSAGGGGSTSVLTQNQIHVMGTIGTPGGVIGDITKPFATLEQAVLAADADPSGGDGLQIVVYPDSYTSTGTTNLARNGLAWHFEAGAIYTHTHNSRMFDCNGFAKPHIITGRGQFVYNVASQIGVFFNETSAVFEFDSFTTTGAQTGIYIFATTTNNLTYLINGREVLGTGSGDGIFIFGTAKHPRVNINLTQAKGTGTGKGVRNGLTSQSKSIVVNIAYAESATTNAILTGGGLWNVDYSFSASGVATSFGGGAGDEVVYNGEAYTMEILVGQKVRGAFFVTDTLTVNSATAKTFGGGCNKLVLTNGTVDELEVYQEATITDGTARLKRYDDGSTPKLNLNGGVTHVLDDIYGGAGLVGNEITVNNDAKLFLHGYNVMAGANKFKFITMLHADCVVDLRDSTIDMQTTAPATAEVIGVDYQAGTLIANGATILNNGQGIPIKTASSSDNVILKGNLNTNYLGTLSTGNLKRLKFQVASISNTTISLDDTVNPLTPFASNLASEALIAADLAFQIDNAQSGLNFTGIYTAGDEFEIEGTVAGVNWLYSVLLNLSLSGTVTPLTQGFTIIGGGTVEQDANII